MTSEHLIDPELAAAMAAFPPFEQISGETLASMRALMDGLAAMQVEQAPRDGVEYSEQRVPGRDGAPAVRVAIYRPLAAAQPMPAYLHMHGGGLVAGRPEIRHIASLAVARDFGCLVVSVDYRLAPETRYPGAVEDCLAALAWLHADAAALGIDPARIVIGGESAGGGLAAALAILARDSGGLPVSFQMLTYPMLDDRSCGDDHPFAGHYVWTRSNNVFGWSAYLGRDPGGAETPHHAAPARCADLAGLPPAFIAVGGLDLFLDEDLDYARRLVRAGVPTELHLYPGAFHAFDMVVEAGVTKAFRRDWLAALGKALQRRSF